MRKHRHRGELVANCSGNFTVECLHHPHRLKLSTEMIYHCGSCEKAVISAVSIGEASFSFSLAMPLGEVCLVSWSYLS